MRNFREEYKKSVGELPEFHMDADRVQDELHHRRMVAARRRKTMISVASAACLFLLCSVGTAAAVNYHSSRIEVERNGFSFLGEGAVACDEAEDVPEIAAFRAIPQEEQIASYDPAKDAGSGKEKAAGGTKEEEAAENDGRESKAVSKVSVDTMECEAELVEEREYDSVEAFRQNEDVVIAIPEIAWLGQPEEVESQLVLVTDAIQMVYVSIDFGEKHFFMRQTDNREYPNYASSTVYPGEAVNVREVANEQGLVYQVFDSVEDGEVISTHAAISVNGRDLTFSFSGYKIDEVDAVLKQLDVSIYFVE